MPIGSGFDQYIGTRQSTVDPTQTEYFNKKTNVGFATPGEVAAYASTLGSGKSIAPDNVFSVLEQGFTAPTTPIDPSAPPVQTAQPDLPKPTAGAVGTEYVTTAQQDLENKRKAVEDRYKSELDAVTKEREATEKRIADIETKQKDVIEQDIEPLTAPFRAELETAERKRLKVEENFFANQALTEELSTLLTQGNNAIKQAQLMSGPSAIIGPRINQVISDVAARAGVIQAVLSARNGQIAQAYNMIDRSVQATVADRNDRLKYYNTLLDFYQNQKDDEGNKLIRLETREQKFIDSQIGLLESDLKNAETTANYIKSLMIDPETAKFVADAGVTLNDSVDTINKKMAEQTKRQEQQTKQKINREEAFKAGITTQFYQRGDAIVRTSDGFEFKDPAQFQQMTGVTLEEAGKRGLISTFTAATTAERGQVLNLMESYPDAGIRPTDSLAIAEGKLKKSRIYQEKIRPPQSDTGPGSTSNVVNTLDTFIRQGDTNEGFPPAGPDGYANPATYNAARQLWIQSKRDVTTFDSKFSKYANPSHAKDYNGVKVNSSNTADDLFNNM